jgi:hypothetical protein
MAELRAVLEYVGMVVGTLTADLAAYIFGLDKSILILKRGISGYSYYKYFNFI